MGVIDDPVKTLFSNTAQADSAIEKISRELEAAVKRRDSCNELAELFRGDMKNGARLQDDLEDFCFFHYGLQMNKELPRVKGFFDRLAGYKGQLLVVDYSGSSWTSSRIVDGQLDRGGTERKILLARLNNPVYSIIFPERNPVVNAVGQQAFFPSRGWTQSDEKISLDPFLRNYRPSESWIACGGLSAGVCSEELEAFKRIIYDTEPHSRLVVGDNAVRDYLKNQNLTIRRQQISRAEIPQIPQIPGLLS